MVVPAAYRQKDVFYFAYVRQTDRQSVDTAAKMCGLLYVTRLCCVHVLVAFAVRGARSFGD